MKTNKTLKVLTASALLASVAAPFAAGVASANSTNILNKVIAVDSSFDASQDGVQNSLTVQEDDVAFDTTSGETFRVVLPTGAKFNGTVGGSYTVANAGPAGTAPTAVLRSSQVLEVTVYGNDAGANKDAVRIPLDFRVDGATGEVKARVEAMDSTISSGEYTIATVGSGKTVATAQSVETIGKTGKAGVLRIEESSLGAIPAGTHQLKLKLPSNFSWLTSGTNATTISTSGGFSSATNVSASGQDLTVDITSSGSNGRGVLYITPGIKADNDASYGDVAVSVVGNDYFSDADVVVGKYADWGVTAKVEEVKEIISGKFDEDTKTAKITIEESVPGTFVDGRDIDIELPSWVKVTNVRERTFSGFSGADPSIATIDGTDSEVNVTVNSRSGSNTKAKIEFKLDLSVQGDKTGDIEAAISGAGVPEQKLVIAKAVAPVSAAVSGEAAKVKIGSQAQAAPDVIITELKRGAIEKNTENGSTTNGTIEVDLPDGVTFASVPKVELVEGNADIDFDNVRRINDNNTLSIPVKSESTKPAKIKLSNLQLTVDRTVPEGAIELKVGGNAVIENSQSARGWLNGSRQAGGSTTGLDAGEFNTSSAAKVVVANTITPAPGDTTASNIVFKLNSKTFTVDGKELEMDTAPLVGWDRAYLPVRFAANALNVSDDQIIWDDKTSTFTVFKGDRVVSGKVGDKFLTVNGAKVPMDVSVWRNKAQTNNRVMVPIRYLSNALNAEIEWNKETSEITIKAAK